jgi:hypothetical protein
MGGMSPIDRIFLGYTLAAGLAAGAVLVVKPELRDFGISPFFWIVIAMAVFELLSFARGGGAPGATITMGIRLLGFALAIAAMIAVQVIAGSPVRFF